MDLIRELLYTEVLFYIQIRDVTNRFEVSTIHHYIQVTAILYTYRLALAVRLGRKQGKDGN